MLMLQVMQKQVRFLFDMRNMVEEEGEERGMIVIVVKHFVGLDFGLWKELIPSLLSDLRSLLITLIQVLLEVHKSGLIEVGVLSQSDS